MKALCEEKKCPSRLSNELNIGPVIDEFVEEATKQNPKAIY